MSWLPRERVVAPVDFSEDSFRAVDVALDLVEKAEQVDVVHVLPELSPVEPGVLWDVVNDQTRTEHVTKALLERFADEKYRGIQIKVLIGEAGSLIADHAKQRKADLIVVPSHGQSALARILVGSVADRIVRLAPCPVLVLRK